MDLNAMDCDRTSERSFFRRENGDKYPFTNDYPAPRPVHGFLGAPLSNHDLIIDCRSITKKLSKYIAFRSDRIMDKKSAQRQQHD
jgi:hypothetical protein